MSVDIKLLHAADSGQLDVVKSHLEAGVNINYAWKKKDGRAYNPLGTPLHYAARSGHFEIVKLLVESGADLNATDIENWTALHYSCNNGHEGIVAYLVSKGIDKTPKDAFYNQTALEFARYRQFNDIVHIIEPNEQLKSRSAKEINKNGIKSVFARNSRKFLFRYELKDSREAEAKLIQFRNDPDHEPLILRANDVELDNLQVSIYFEHDFAAHRAHAQAMRAEGKLVRSSTISTNEHINFICEIDSK